MDAGTYGDAIRRLRNRIGMSQGQLVEATGLDRSYVSRVENGRITMPTPEVRHRFAQALGVTDDEVLAELGPGQRIRGTGLPSPPYDYVPEDDRDYLVHLFEGFRLTPDRAAILEAMVSAWRKLDSENGQSS